MWGVNDKMSKRNNCTKHINTMTNKIECMDKIKHTDKIKVSYSKLDHSDKITVDKMQYIKDNALGLATRPEIEHIVVNKHLKHIAEYLCVGEYSLNCDKICLFSDGLEYFMEITHSTLEQQIAKTISHEIMHRILFYDHGENECRAFDNIAEKLKAYGVW